MKKAPKQKIRKVIEAAGELEPGAVVHITIKHDDDCPALRTHRLADCTCNPRIEKEIEQ